MIAGLRPYLGLLICRWRAANLAVLSLVAWLVWSCSAPQPPNLDCGSDFYERQQLKNLNKFEQKVQIRKFLIENHFSIALQTFGLSSSPKILPGSRNVNVWRSGGRCLAPLENPGNQNLWIFAMHMGLMLWGTQKENIGLHAWPKAIQKRYKAHAFRRLDRNASLPPVFGPALKGPKKQVKIIKLLFNFFMDDKKVCYSFLGKNIYFPSAGRKAIEIEFASFPKKGAAFACRSCR